MNLLTSFLSKNSRRSIAIRALIVYLLIGLSISTAENIYGYFIGAPTAFVWTGSILNNLILFFWWFLVPCIIWPIDLYWTVFHKIT
jgi:hypothetical protein